MAVDDRKWRYGQNVTMRISRYVRSFIGKESSHLVVKGRKCEAHRILVPDGRRLGKLKTNRTVCCHNGHSPKVCSVVSGAILQLGRAAVIEMPQWYRNRLVAIGSAR